MFAEILSTPRLRLGTAALCALLAMIAYAPAQLLPFISDDYLQIELARKYGTVSGLASLATDALYRCRATSLILTHWTESAFGLNPLAYNLSSLAIHVLNCLLVMALGIWRPVGHRVAYAGAVFFAFVEGHHEAVIWYAALPELLVLTFSMISFIFWVRWLQSPKATAFWYAVAFGAYLLALASKESAVCVTGLLALSILLEPARARRHWLGVVPFAFTAAVYFLFIYWARTEHLHFNDGTFSLRAPFWWTLVYSSLRLFWFWGTLALIVLAALKRLRSRFIVLIVGWILITFLPYSFLTYMTRVPSRHTLFASGALALVLGAAAVAGWRFALMRGPGARYALCALLIACFVQNAGYLWTRKQRQFEERAEVTERILRQVVSTAGPIDLACFPHHPTVAYQAVRVMYPSAIGRLVVGSTENCQPAPSPLPPIGQEPSPDAPTQTKSTTMSKESGIY